MKLRLHWERGGDPDGPKVLFVNGTGGDLRAEPSVFTWPIAQGFDLLAYDRLPALTMPTFVCAGRRDGIAPLSNSEALAAQIPGGELAVFDGGHLFLMQDKAAWPRITTFLQGG